MEFETFAERAAEIESVSSDLETVELVASLLADGGDDVAIVARFIQGRIFPAHDQTKLDIGPSLCYTALARAAGPNTTVADIEDELARVGEIGRVAEKLDLSGQQGLAAFGATDTGTLTVRSVASALESIATAEGAGSTDTKVDTLFGLFTQAEPIEVRFLARLVLGEMRISVGEGTVRDAIAETSTVPVADVERAIQVTNDVGMVARIAREEGTSGLENLGLKVGRPVKAMLAQAGTAMEALDTWETVIVETKYDGARVQIHYSGSNIQLYSRNLENVTHALPEVVDFVEDHLDRPAILDGEVVATDEESNPLPFQEVLRRFRRKHDIERTREQVEITFHPFDCLHIDGTDLLSKSLTTRLEYLDVLFETGSDAIEATQIATIQNKEQAALKAGHEGIMLKNPESPYTPGSRGKNWLKRKPDVETLDLVVTGAEWGEGRRATFMGTFQLSVRDGDSFKPIGNVATGITDERLADLTERFEPHVKSSTGTELTIEPAVVFEVGYEEIQRSPTYESGFALRFPRFIAVREDKDPADADSLERVEQLAAI